MRPAERVVAASALALALPTLVARFPPMTDLPLHAETVGLLRHFGDPAFVPPGLYQRNFGHPNQLFHLLAWGLSYLLGVDGGCKLVVAASQVGVVLGGLRLARHVGASPWCALLFAPLALGWTYHIGLVANLLGLAVLFAVLPSLDDAVAVPRPGSVARSCACMLLLYAAHESVLVVGAAAVVLFTVARATERRQAFSAVAMRVAPAIFAALVVLLQLAAQRHALAGSGADDAAIVWRSPAQTLLDLPYTLTGLPDLTVSSALAALTALAALAFAPGLAARVNPGESAFVRHRFLVAGVACLVATLVFPFGFAHGTAFNQRFVGPAVGLLVVGLGGTCSSSLRQLPLLLAIAVPLAFFLVTLPELIDSDRQNRALDTLFEQVQTGSAVAAIEGDPDKGGRAYAIVSTAARVVALRGGRATTSFNESAIAPVVLRPEHVWRESEARLANNTLDFEPSRDFHLYRYALVHSRNAAIEAAAPEAMAPDGRKLGQAGEWQLFEATGPVVPLTAPEPPPPPPEADVETFRIRAIRSMRALAHAGADRR